MEQQPPVWHDLRGGPAGVERWNARSDEERQQGDPFHETNLSGATLPGANLAGLDWQDARFDDARMAGCWLLESNLTRAGLTRARLDKAWCAGACLREANFQGAVLAGANLRGCDCRGTCFREADLSGATLDNADLRGADLTGANLAGASVRGARYGSDTRFPPGFVPRGLMEWAGGGQPPLDLDMFVKRIREHVDPGRLRRALEMLQADRFQLYAEVEDGAMAGVIRSQNDPDVVYSCRLTEEGRFACATQELTACLGMRSALCKHLLVLIIGLTRGGRIEPGVVCGWVEASRMRTPVLNEAKLSESLLRYKAAQIGEVDWRPTETIPEDYYTL